MVSENLPINGFLAARDKVVTTQWRNWITLWVISVSITVGQMAIVGLQMSCSYS